ncbi:MAG TPA: hypothetical protein VGE97_00495, partial [Nitrososphaera sp.]
WAAHCEIISRCMGNEDNTFLKSYEENAKIQTEQVIETSQIATCIAHFVETDPRFNGEAMIKDLQGNPLWGWVGIATTLKAELEAVAGDLKIDIKGKGWPKDPTWLVRRLNEILHTLKDAGIEIEYDHTNRAKKNIMIRKLPSLASLASQTQIYAQKEGQTSDAIRDAKKKDNEIASQNHAQEKARDANNARDANLHTSKQKPKPKFVKCPRCGEMLDADPYYQKLHRCDL